MEDWDEQRAREREVNHHHLPKERTLSAEQEAALERILSRSHPLGGRAPSRDERHER